MYTIISGTNRTGSYSIKIARQYQQMLAEKGVQSSLISLEHLDVSKRNAALKILEEKILIPATKFVFIAPEYNGSIPGVLKSLIDSSDIQKDWWGKKALLVGISTGRAGNLRGMDHLTAILNYVNMVVHPNKLPISVVHKLVNEEGEIIDKSTLQAINVQLDEFIAF
jgi:chromate reductase